MDASSLEYLRKETETKQVILENPVIVKSKFKQFVLVLDKGEYSDYLTPLIVELDHEAIEEIYLIMEFKSTAVHEVLTHTEKYPVADFDLKIVNALMASMD
jgi:energy-converting hydrogenase Eha subunit F